MDRDSVVPMTAEHAPEVLAIYQAGIDEGNATFETRAPTWEPTPMRVAEAGPVQSP